MGSVSQRLAAATVARVLRVAGPGLRAVTVDVFDTLLLRRIPSSEVSAAQAARVAQALRPAGGTAAILRVQAHRWAWEQALATAARRGPVEASLHAWADALAQDLDEDPAHVRTLVDDAWVWCETRANDLHTPLWEALQQAAATHNLQLVALSDGWALEPQLVALLDNFGLRFDRVISSASQGISKRHGGLFPRAHALLQLPASQVLHIGDNLEADILRAGLSGTPAVWLPHRGSVGRRQVHTQQSRGQTVAALLAPAADANVQTVADFSRTILAPLLAVWDLAVRRNVARQRCDQRVYIARDGARPHAFAARVDELLGAPTPRVYLRLSRRVVGLLHPARLLESMPGLAGRAARQTVGDLLAPFDLPIPLHEQLLTISGLRAASGVDRPTLAILASAAWDVRGPLEDLRQTRAAQLRAYLDQHAPDGTRWMLVDAGWTGTTQDVLADVLPRLTHVAGTYLGVSTPYPAPAHVWRWGLLRDESSGRNVAARWSERLAANLRIWEVILREPVPTVARLHTLPTGEVVPVLASPEPAHLAEAHLARQIDTGLDAAWGDLAPRIALAAELLPLLTDADLRDAARRITAPFAWRPGTALSRDLLAVGYDEAGGQRRSLGGLLQDPRDVWWPGVLGRGW